MPKKGITKAIVPTKTPPVWQIGILFPNGKKISKPKCTLNEVFNTYFIGLDKYLNKDFTAEELFEKYKNTFSSKGIKVVIHYIDSWGHKWTGKIAWPKESKFIEYLNKRLNENYS
jgi:hypothetical protein